MRAKGLARPRTISRRVVAASDDVEDWGDFPEMWQAKGLRGKQEELWKCALTGRTGRGTIPPDIPAL
jgi:hypothetical protein